MICQWFSWVTKWQVKIMGKAHYERPKIVIHGNECVISLLTCYFMSWTHNSAKNNHQSLILQLSPRAVFSDLSLWRHHGWSVTSRVSYWYCDIVFVGCFCMCKLAPRRFSLVNNNRECQFLFTWLEMRILYPYLVFHDICNIIILSCQISLQHIFIHNDKSEKKE